MTRLYQIQETVRLRAQEVLSAHEDWPCRKGCDECCRRLAAIPRVTAQEWQLMASAIDALPAETAQLVRRRIQDSAGLPRPVVCPLLDTDSGTCLIYEARPVACRAYGFYAEREFVLGCSRIKSMGEQSPDVVWGNHLALEEWLQSLGPTADLSDWIAGK